MTRSILRCSAAVALVAAVTSPARAQVPAVADTGKRALAVRLMQVTRVTESILAGIEAGLPAQRAATPQLPKEFWERFSKYAREGVDSLAVMLLPVYTEAFSAQDMRELIAFYETPLGQRLIRAQPGILVRSTQVGQQWGTGIGLRVALELQNPDPTKPPQ